MTELPPELQHIGLGARTFKKRSGPENKDRSIWTDTPADRERKARVVNCHETVFFPYVMFLCVMELLFINRNALRERRRVKRREMTAHNFLRKTWTWQRKCLSIMYVFFWCYCFCLGHFTDFHFKLLCVYTLPVTRSPNVLSL